MVNIKQLIFIGLFLVFPIIATAEQDTATADLIKQLSLRQDKHPIRQATYWQKPKRIVITLLDQQKKSKPDAIDWLREVAGNAEIIVADSRKVSPALLEGADVLLGYCNHHNLKHGKQLRYILNYSAGVDKCISSPLAKQREILVTNMQRVYGPGIAEHVIAMMYMLTRKLYVYYDRQRLRQWDRKAVQRSSMWEVQDRTMLVVGLGGIGTEVAKRAHALGMKVIAIRNSSRSGPNYVDKVGLPTDLHQFAAKADIVVNTTPLTPKTKGLFDQQFFRTMQQGAYFINVGRGKSVVTSDLIAALNSEHLGGAALDVQDPEPLPENHPLWTAKNVVITPHISAGSSRRMSRYWLVVRENLRRYVKGERMLNVVNLKRGY